MLNIKHFKYLDDEELGDYTRKPIWKKYWSTRRVRKV